MAGVIFSVLKVYTLTFYGIISAKPAFY